MSPNTPSSKDEFQSTVDSAIDNMFNPTRKIEIDPQTGEVKEAAPAVADEPISLSLESDDSTAEEEIVLEVQTTSPTQQLLEDLDQSFMALDWEVSSANITAFQKLLNQVQKECAIQETSLPGQVVTEMNAVLGAMVSSADALPASAVKTLQKGLVVLREATAENTDNLDAVTGLATKTIEALKAIVATAAAPEPGIEEEGISLNIESEPTIEEDPASESSGEMVPEEMLLDIPDDPIPLETSNTINLHLTMLSQCINRILPLEQLFGQNERYGRLLSKHRELRELLEEEKDLLTSALIADQTGAPKKQGTNIPLVLFEAIKKHHAVLRGACQSVKVLEKAFAAKKGYEKLSSIEYSIFCQLTGQYETLQGLLQGSAQQTPRAQTTKTASAHIESTLTNHLQVLATCIKEIIPMENLFGKTKGYEKLHALQKKIRSQLAGQETQLRNMLQDGLSCETTAGHVSQPPSDISQTATIPWTKLQLSSWQGTRVAFVPEEIGMEYTKPGALQKIQHGATSFSLKSLRKWPWNKVQPLTKNILAEKGEKELLTLSFPVLSAPTASASSTSKSQKSILLLLHKNHAQAAAFIDGPTEELTVLPDDHWQPFVFPGNPYIKGILTTKSESMILFSLPESED